MKKSFIWILGAVLAGSLLASCSLEEPTQTLISSAELGINTVATLTKGYVEGPDMLDTPFNGLHDAGAVKTERTITMSAYLTPASGQSGDARDYFRAETFSKNANGESDNLWHHNPKVFWPMGATLDFLAYSVGTPFQATAVRWETARATDGVTLRVDRAYRQDDILYAYAGAHNASSGAAVDMQFRHSQAWLQFNVHAAEAGIVTLDGIEIERLYNDGELRIARDGAAATASWNFRQSTAENTMLPDINNVFGTVIGTTVSHFDQLIPEQPMQAVTIYYHLPGITMPLQYRYDMPVSSWVMGKKYIYDITLSPKEIRVQPSVVEWNTETEVVFDNSMDITGTNIDHMGSDFDFSTGSTIRWHLNDSQDYVNLTYVSGSWDNEVIFNSEDYFVTITKLPNGEYNVSYSPDYSKQYFSVIANETGTITYRKGSVSPLQYSLNDGNWIPMPNSINVTNGDVVRFKGVNNKVSIGNTVNSNNTPFAFSASVSIQGNIMSLIYGDEFRGKTELKSEESFSGCFYGCSTLYSCENLILPSFNLTNSCYRWMFTDCSQITKTPKFTITNIGEFSLQYMFSNCSNLTTISEINITLSSEIKRCGLNRMFYRCTSLNDASLLKIEATGILNSGCSEMFTECGSLVISPKITITGSGVYENYAMEKMFRMCTSLTDASTIEISVNSEPRTYAFLETFCFTSQLTKGPKINVNVYNAKEFDGMFKFSGIQDASSIYINAAIISGCESMFAYCSRLVSAPTINCTETVSGMREMFRSCNSLVDASSINISATTIKANGCRDMFYACESLIYPPIITNTETVEESGMNNMFTSCSALIEGPVLSARVLTRICYYGIFKYCSSLTNVTCLATDISAEGCLDDWLYGVPASGTFIKNASMSSWPSGASGIPAGWNVVDY